MDSVKLLDSLGAEVSMRRKMREGTTANKSAPLPDGVQTLTVPQSATTAVFFSDGKEILRLPLELSASEVNYLRP